ncbi:MAG TPA: CocE/NonD family hydrolase [Verrucomicrobiae bacterium]|jgi:hypothetical protein|nr:CocE/NonD family hydrolase [Verrucomicrobiae bacterium]
MKAQNILVGLAMTLTLAAARAEDHAGPSDLDLFRARYTKYEYRIAMRDGVKLFTSVYAPKDRSEKHPLLIQRTPYSVSPYGADNYRVPPSPWESLVKENFILVFQDVRGRYESEGEFVDVPILKETLHGPKDTDESTDTYDTIDWLVKNVPNNNGRAGLWGISYPGFFAACSLVRAHPALRAVSPQAPIGDIANGDDAYHNGAFYLAANFGFYTGFKPRGPEPERPKNHEAFDYGTPDQYEFYLRMGALANADARYLKGGNVYWTDTLAHPNYDSFWSSRALAPHMKHITPAVLFVGGWFDAEDLAGPLGLFRAVDKDGSSPALTLAMGPWRHGGWSRADGDKLGHLNFATKTGEFFREHIQLPFFIQHLENKPGTNFPKAWLFETGRNEWRTFGAWPPTNAARKSLYLGPNGTLAFAPCARQAPDYDEYVSDPAKPVPVTDAIDEGMPGDYMTRDQRFASRRTDVLTYQTEPLEADVTIAGPVTPSLRVASSGTDSDFVVKLIDVYPDDFPNPEPNPMDVRMEGYQQLVRGEPFRAKFRHGMEKPEPLVAGQPDKIEFAMPDVLHTFRTGHRIMVQIQSSWFPMVDRNPQTFVNIPTAKETDFQKAVERVWRGGTDASRLDVLVVDE